MAKHTKLELRAGELSTELAEVQNQIRNKRLTGDNKAETPEKKAKSKPKGHVRRGSPRKK
jgi:hypothetical protein